MTIKEDIERDDREVFEWGTELKTKLCAVIDQEFKDIDDLHRTDTVKKRCRQRLGNLQHRILSWR